MLRSCAPLDFGSSHSTTAILKFKWPFRLSDQIVSSPPLDSSSLSSFISIFSFPLMPLHTVRWRICIGHRCVLRVPCMSVPATLRHQTHSRPFSCQRNAVAADDLNFEFKFHFSKKAPQVHHHRLIKMSTTANKSSVNFCADKLIG